MFVDQKLAMLKIRSTSVTFLCLCYLTTASEDTMQLRRLTKYSNESLQTFLLGEVEFLDF